MIFYYKSKSIYKFHVLVCLCLSKKGLFQKVWEIDVKLIDDDVFGIFFSLEKSLSLKKSKKYCYGNKNTYKIHLFPFQNDFGSMPEIGENSLKWGFSFVDFGSDKFSDVFLNDSLWTSELQHCRCIRFGTKVAGKYSQHAKNVAKSWGSLIALRRLVLGPFRMCAT